MTVSRQNSITFDTSLWERIIEKRYEDREKKRQELLQALIKSLKDYFKDKRVKRVYILGSILREGEFYEFSDIDIVVEGLKEDYFRISAEIENIVDRDIDLIELEKCRFSNSIERQGLRVI